VTCVVLLVLLEMPPIAVRLQLPLSQPNFQLPAGAPDRSTKDLGQGGLLHKDSIVKLPLDSMCYRSTLDLVRMIECCNMHRSMLHA
jgi:hypothetical protein